MKLLTFVYTIDTIISFLAIPIYHPYLRTVINNTHFHHFINRCFYLIKFISYCFQIHSSEHTCMKIWEDIDNIVAHVSMEYNDKMYSIFITR